MGDVIIIITIVVFQKCLSFGAHKKATLDGFDPCCILGCEGHLIGIIRINTDLSTRLSPNVLWKF